MVETFFKESNIDVALGEIGQECYANGPQDQCNSNSMGWMNCCANLMITDTDSGDQAEIHRCMAQDVIDRGVSMSVAGWTMAAKCTDTRF